MNPLIQKKILRLARVAAFFPLFPTIVQTDELSTPTGYIWWVLAGVLILLFDKKRKAVFQKLLQDSL